MKRTRLRRTSRLARIGRRRSPARILRKRLWTELSRLIRARDGHCLMANQEFGACAGVLQGSHIFPKGKYPLLELFPLNVKTLCYRHHFYEWANNPLMVAAWLRRTLSEAWIDQLIAEKNRSLARKGMTEDEIRVEWAAFGLGK